MHSLILGGTRGLGRELMHLFHARRHTISVVGLRPPTAADQTLSGVHFWTTDVSDGARLTATIGEVLSRNGPVNNAVFVQRFRAEGDLWEGELATSVTATHRAIEALVDHFAETGVKSIVLVGSIADEHVADSQPAGYHAAKAALRQLARYYAVVLGPRGIRVNSVSPGTMLKDENREFYARNPSLVEALERIIPLRRLGTAADSAQVIAFLCSPEAGFVTGQRITVDGGASLVSQESLARRLAGA